MRRNESDRNEAPQYWFNLRTLKVEKGLKTAAAYRIGPFDTESAAADALKLIRSRSVAWDDSERQEDAL